MVEQAQAGEMASGGRHAPAAIRVEFASFGAGIDTIGFQAIERFLAYSKRNGEIDSVDQRRFGREGEVSLCIQFRDYRAAARAAADIGRIIWLGVENGYPNAYRYELACEQGQWSSMGGSNLSPFYDNPDIPRDTLTCTYSDEDSGYRAQLLVSERIRNPRLGRGETLDMSWRLLQSSPTARYAPIHDAATEVSLSTEDTRSYTFEYTGERTKVSFYPTFSVGEAMYYAEVALAGAGAGASVSRLVCR